MKNKRYFTTKLLIAVALVALTATGALWEIRGVRAKPNPMPTAVESQTSFGAIGIAAGQTMRVSVANTLVNDPTIPPGPCRVLINFRDMNGDLVANRGGQVIFRTVQLDPGQTAYLDLNFAQLPPVASTATFLGRIQLRPVITVTEPPGPPTLPPGPCVPVVEVFDSITGRTQFAISSGPVIQISDAVPVNG